MTVIFQIFFDRYFLKLEMFENGQKKSQNIEDNKINFLYFNKFVTT